jgi:hypothetical protein
MLLLLVVVVVLSHIRDVYKEIKVLIQQEFLETLLLMSKQW